MVDSNTHDTVDMHIAGQWHARARVCVCVAAGWRGYQRLQCCTPACPVFACKRALCPIGVEFAKEQKYMHENTIEASTLVQFTLEAINYCEVDGTSTTSRSHHVQICQENESSKKTQNGGQSQTFAKNRHPQKKQTKKKTVFALFWISTLRPCQR